MFAPISPFRSLLRQSPSIRQAIRWNSKTVHVTDHTLVRPYPLRIPSSVRKDIARELSYANLNLLIGSFNDPSSQASAQEVFQSIVKKPERKYFVSIADEAALKKVQEIGLKQLIYSHSVSDSYSKKFAFCTSDESLARLSNILIQRKSAEGTSTRVNVPCCPTCPIEGPIPVEKIVGLVQKLLEMGCDEVVLSDTAGKTSPLQIEQFLKALKGAGVDMEKIGLQLYGNGNEAFPNVRKGLEFDVRRFDSAMKFFPETTMKNDIPSTSTEGLVSFLEKEGYKTEVNLERTRKAYNILFNYVVLND